jgi:hypothetical protein
MLYKLDPSNNYYAIFCHSVSCEMWHHAGMQIGHRSNVWLWSFKTMAPLVSDQVTKNRVEVFLF